MTKPDFSLEIGLWKKNHQIVIGVDEVGRGSFAGPVVAGAAAVKIRKYELGNLNKRGKNSDFDKKLLQDISDLGINDSKKLSAKRRGELLHDIKKYFFWSTGESSVAVINRCGIKKATESAMRNAVLKLFFQVVQTQNLQMKSGLMNLSIIAKLKPYLLIDAFQMKYVPVAGLNHQRAVAGGDGKSVSIAAASIIAKVYRDRLMSQMSEPFKQYHWEKNKGYGTLDHREAIRKYGICRIHRKQFVRKWIRIK